MDFGSFPIPFVRATKGIGKLTFEDRSDLHVIAVILIGAEIRKARISPAYLVLDAVRWGHKLLDEQLRSLDEARRMKNAALQLHHANRARELKRWIEDERAPLDSFPLLQRRAAIGPRIVHDKDLDTYLSSIELRMAPAPPKSQAQILIDASWRPAILYCTAATSLAHEFTSADIIAVRLAVRELQERIANSTAPWAAMDRK